MAKRLRDPARRKLPSYQKLSFKAKGVLTYLEDNCESSGIWPANFELSSVELGVKFDAQFLADELSDRVWRIDDERYFIKSYFDEQFASAKDTFNAKKAAIETMSRLGILVDANGTVTRQSTDGYPTVTQRSADSHQTVDGQSNYIIIKDKSIERGVGETNSPPDPKPEKPKLDFELVYAEYPKRPNTEKGDGLALLAKQIKTLEDLTLAIKAAKNYAEHCRIEETDTSFIKQFRTWCGLDKQRVPRWREWVNWTPDQSSPPKRPPAVSQRPEPKLISYPTAAAVIAEQEAQRARDAGPPLTAEERQALLSNFRQKVSGIVKGIA